MPQSYENKYKRIPGIKNKNKNKSRVKLGNFIIMQV